MAKISLVIAIVVTLLTAGLAFMTKTKVDDLQNTLKSTKNTLTSTQGKLTKTESELKKTNEDLTAANKTIDDQKGQLTAKDSEIADAKKKTDDLTAQMAAKDMQLADLAAEKQKILDSIPAGVDPKKLAEEVKQMTDELTKDKNDLAEKDQVITTLNTKVKDETTQLDSAKHEVEHYQKDVALHAFTGKVVAVNPGWGFAVLDVGDKQGATVNTPLIVIRNGQNIGRVKITAVEPSTSIADVIPGSMARGQTLQPGDQVIFGSKSPKISNTAAPSGTGSSATSVNNNAPLPNQ